MKSKKLISFLCAAALTVSSFAGLTISANAAAGDKIGSDLLNLNFNSTTNFATADPEEPNYDGVLANGTSTGSVTATILTDGTAVKTVGEGQTAALTLVTGSRGNGDRGWYTDSANTLVKTGSYYAIEEKTAEDKYLHMSYPQFGDFENTSGFRWAHVDFPATYTATAEKDYVVEFKAKFTSGTNAGVVSTENPYNPVLRIGTFDTTAHTSNAVAINKRELNIGDDWVTVKAVTSLKGTKVYLNGSETYSATSPTTVSITGFGLYSEDGKSNISPPLDVKGDSLLADKHTLTPVVDIDDLVIYEAEPEKEADVTINYKDEEGAVIKTATTVSAIVGKQFTVPENYKADIDPDTDEVKSDKYYKYKSGADSITVADSDNVINLVFESVDKPTLTFKAVKASDKSEITTLSTQKLMEGKSATYFYPFYTKDSNGNYYKAKTATNSRSSGTVEAGGTTVNIEYVPVGNVIDFVEAEAYGQEEGKLSIGNTNSTNSSGYSSSGPTVDGIMGIESAAIQTAGVYDVKFNIDTAKVRGCYAAKVAEDGTVTDLLDGYEGAEATTSTDGWYWTKETGLITLEGVELAAGDKIRIYGYNSKSKNAWNLEAPCLFDYLLITKSAEPEIALTYDKATKTATMNVTNAADVGESVKATLIHSSYNNDSSLKDIEVFDETLAIADDGTISATQALSKAVAQGDKLMLWDSLNGLKPLAVAHNITAAEADDDAPTPTKVDVTAVALDKKTGIKIGDTLTATTTPADADVAYVWASSTDGETYTTIDGATSSTYTVAAADYDKYIKVTVTGQNTHQGTQADATTEKVAKKTIEGATVAISAVAESDNIKATVTTTNDGDAAKFTQFAWEYSADGTTYAALDPAVTGDTVTNAAAGYYKVTASIPASNTEFTGTTAQSAAYQVLPKTYTVSGTASAGITKVALTGNGIAAGAKEVVPSSANEYAVEFTGIPAGTGYTVTATVSDDYYLETATATVDVSTTNVANAFTFTAIPNLTGTPTISGTPNENEVQTAVVTSLNATTGLSYQWQKLKAEGNEATDEDWENVESATEATFTPTAEGKYRVVVGAIGYNGSAKSAAVTIYAAGVTTHTVTVTATDKSIKAATLTADEKATINGSVDTETGVITFAGALGDTTYTLNVTEYGEGFKAPSTLEGGSAGALTITVESTDVTKNITSTAKTKATIAIGALTGGTVKITKTDGVTEIADVDNGTEGTQVYEGTQFKVIPTAADHYTVGTTTVNDGTNGVEAAEGVYTVPENSTATYTVTQTFVLDKHTITFDKGSSDTALTGTTSYQVDYNTAPGEAISALPTATKDNMTFDKWYLSTDETKAAVTLDAIKAALVTENVTYVAAYKAVVTLDSQGTTSTYDVSEFAADNKLTSTQIEAIEALNPTKADATFAGWKTGTDEPITTAALTALAFTANVTYAAQFTDNVALTYADGDHYSVAAAYATDHTNYASATKVAPNTEVDITITPGEGYEVTGVSVGGTALNKNETTGTPLPNTYTVTPTGVVSAKVRITADAALTVTVGEKAAAGYTITSYSDSADPASTVTVTKIGETDNSTTNPTASENAVITIKVNAAAGKQLKADSLKVVMEGKTIGVDEYAGETLTQPDSSDNTTYTFTMPAGNVSISAEFEAVAAATVDYDQYLIGAKDAPVTFADVTVNTANSGSWRIAGSGTGTTAADNENSQLKLTPASSSFYVSGIFQNPPVANNIVGVHLDYKPVSGGVILNLDTKGNNSANNDANTAIAVSLTADGLIYQGETIAALTANEWNTVDIKYDFDLATATFKVGNGTSVTKDLYNKNGVAYKSNNNVRPIASELYRLQFTQASSGEGYVTNLTVGSIARTDALAKKTLTVTKNGSIGDVYIGESGTTSSEVDQSTYVTATAADSTTVRFDNWTNADGSTELGTDKTIIRRVYDDETIRANFTQLYAVALTYKVNDTAVEGLDVTIGEDKKTTDANGLVTFYLENGSYTATTAASAGNYLESSTNLTVSDDGITQDVALTADATKTANIKISTSVEGAKVVLTDSESVTTTVFTDADGNVTFENKPSESSTYTYAVTMLGYANKNGSITLETSDADTTKTETVTMEKNAGVLLVDTFDSSKALSETWTVPTVGSTSFVKALGTTTTTNTANRPDIVLQSEPGDFDTSNGAFAHLGTLAYSNQNKNYGPCSATKSGLALTTENDGFEIEFDMLGPTYSSNTSGKASASSEILFTDSAGNVLLGFKHTQNSGSNGTLSAFSGGVQPEASTTTQLTDNSTSVTALVSSNSAIKSKWVHVKAIVNVTSGKAVITVTNDSGTLANALEVNLADTKTKSINSLRLVSGQSMSVLYGESGLEIDNLIISEYTAE